MVQGLQLNAVDGAGNTALLDAIRHSHREVQAALRAAGANLAAVNVADKLCLAAAENDTAILQVPILAPSACCCGFAVVDLLLAAAHSWSSFSEW
jgi:ankyrin repeat protein